MAITQTLNARSITIFPAVPAGSLVSVAAGAGASLTVEYSVGSVADVTNGTATWVNWPKGALSASTTLADVTATLLNLRLTITGGSGSVVIDDSPTMRTVEPYKQDWESGFNTPVLLAANGAQPAVLTNPTIQATNSVDNYTQISIQNKSATANASADLIAYPDNVSASDLTGFMDFGITSSAFAQAAYAVTGQNEGYIFMSAPSGAGKTGNMVIATDATGSRNDIRFCTNGFNSASNLRVKIKKEGQVNFAPLAADPANAEKGDVYCNSVSNKLKFYNGTTWETITSA